MITSWKTWAVFLAVLAIGAIGWAVWGRGGDDGDEEPKVVLPGEFEPAGALVLACHDANGATPWMTLAQVIRATPESLPIVLLAADLSDGLAAEEFLKQLNLGPGRVHLLRAGHGAPDIGRFGPLGVAREAGPALVDTPRLPRRPVENEQAVFALAKTLKVPIVRAAMFTDGNVLSNGLGLALTTTALLDRNAEPGIGEGPLREMFRRAYGIRQTVFLERLEGEPSGNVRMFAAFTSADTVVVGRYDPRVDPVNAAVLDRNAAALAEVEAAPGEKKLKVVRVPMPPHNPGLWRTYTSVVFAGKVLMVPVYPGIDARGQREASDTYAKLLPDWRIVPIDVRSAAGHAGAPRSLVLPLGAIRRLPKLPEPRWD